MFAFPDQETVRNVVYQLPRVGVGVKYGLPQSRKTSLMTPRQLFKHSDMCLKWQKPIGALSEARRKFFQERYTSWEDETIPAFHYGTHYSTQAFTLNWLMRVEPFTTMFLDMQNGRFDHPDRVFHSIAETWERCQKDSHDVKELIPELFYLSEMMRNNNGFELGTRSDGVKIGDVVLPKWASTPEEFVLLHRQALESDLVSCQLNQWIDLIFGYKQKGPEAVRATNVFYYLTYEGAVCLKSIENAAQLEAIQQQIQSFGQTPVQLLAEAHPPRHSVMTMAPLMFRRCEDDLCMLMKFISNSPVVFLAANTFHQLPQPTVVSVAQNLVFALNRWDNSYTYGTTTRSALSLGTEKAADSDNASVNLRVVGCVSPLKVKNHENELPLTVDPLLASGNPSVPVVRRHLGDSLDHRLTQGFVAGEYNTPGETPSPRAILTGHEAAISALAVSAEHGLVLSGCEDGTILMHTTAGELLRRWNGKQRVSQLLMSRECVVMAIYGHHRFITLSTTANQLDEAVTDEKIECACLTRDGEYVITGSESGRCAVWRLFPLRKLYSFQRSKDRLSETDQITLLGLIPYALDFMGNENQVDSAVRSVAVSANHRFVLAGLDSGSIVVFNVDFNRWHYEYKTRYQVQK
ncbi:Beige/BEACH domain protein [Necator americanus]|uniref:Beige/BEACH domain protein n=1 Tax=Necator americanus TaxID=51031 RepID=W2THW2_NECAM|nr:Beige/BEACH domain protein [Necator americanus]ETN81398.1 Beige/BEACH domain protein [Necator americanus]